MEHFCKDCIYLCYGRYCNRTYNEDKQYYGWASLAEYSCNGKCKYYKRNTFWYKIKKAIDKLGGKIYNIRFLNPFKQKNIKKRIIIRTKMKSMPLSCKDCSLHSFSHSLEETLIGCPLLKRQLTKEEIKEGKLKFPDCPLEEDNKKVGE